MSEVVRRSDMRLTAALDTGSSGTDDSPQRTYE